MKVMNGVLTSVTNEDIKNGTFVFPNGITTIRDYAFFSCKSLISIEIPNSVTSIGENTFSCCSSLTSIEIPDSVISIGESTFNRCSSLTSIKIPNGVTSIGSFTFNGCSSLTSIEIPNSITSIGESTFNGCSSLSSIEIPNSVTSIGESTFNGCSSLSSIDLPDGVTSIGESTFNGCSSLTSIKIPNSVTSIGDYAFNYCSSLTSIEIPNSVTSIGDYAFNDCSSLTSIKIPNSVTSIGENTFSCCSSLTSIEIPNGVTSIGNSAFEECGSLTSIDLPDYVISIGNSAFSGCISLTSIKILDSVTDIGNHSFKNCPNIHSLITPWGTINLSSPTTKNICINYLYLYANFILKEKYLNIEEFLNQDSINAVISDDDIFAENAIGKFKNLFYKTRKNFDIPKSLFSAFSIEQTEKFNYHIWNQIKNSFSYQDDVDMSESFAEMIGLFGLFDIDSTTQKRISEFQSFLNYFSPISKNSLEMLCTTNLSSKEMLMNSFIEVEVPYYILNDGVEISEEFSIYLDNELTDKKMKRIKKLSGNFGKRINDFVKENYQTIYKTRYTLKDNVDEDIRLLLFNTNVENQINHDSLHRIFDGCKKEYDPEFYQFFLDNFEDILADEKTQRNVKEIGKHFQNIREYYQSHSGSSEITLKQVLDFIKNVSFTYHPGNYELVQDLKNAGVVSEEAFDYYQSVYEENQVRKKSSLVKRSNTYQVNGYTIKAELLRRDDSLVLLVGETNFTNCCQVYNGIGHNCMAHATRSSDGGVFVTKLLKDDRWILLTMSWDWQNNNVYCHDNIEATPSFKHGDSSLKEAVALAYQKDAQCIIEKSKNEVEKYILDRKKILEKNHDTKGLEELKELENRQVIRLVTCGSGYDDLGLSEYFSNTISVNESFMIKNQRFTLQNFQPVHYNSSQVWFNDKKSAYSDSDTKQYIMAGSLENLCLGKLEPLVPIYRDDRKVVLEEKDSIRDYTIHKIKEMEKVSYPDTMKQYRETDKETFSASKIYLGEDWYLVYEERDNHSIYISDLARVNPTLEDEKTAQSQEMMNVIYDLVRKYDIIEADLRENTSYLLYLMNKKLGYLEQIGEDTVYPFDNQGNKRVVSLQEQDMMLGKVNQIKQAGNQDNLMHHVTFRKGRLLSGDMQIESTNETSKTLL